MIITNLVKHKYFNLTYDAKNNFTTFPIHNNNVWEMYKKQLACIWTAEEIDFSQDKTDWENKLNNDERTFVKNILGFFAASDGIVNRNLQTIGGIINFDDIEIKEVSYCWNFQRMMEDIHSETYSLMIDTYITDPSEKLKTLNSIVTIPCVKEKADWALKWIKPIEPGMENIFSAERLIAFIIVEGMFFSGSFAAIFWLKTRNLLRGLTFSNELISRDEGLHCDFGIMMYSLLNDKLDEDTVHNMFKEAVEIEKKFITESISCRLIGMNCKLMKEYIEYVSDRLLVLLGYNKIWGTANPFDFMENISLAGKQNFFEGRNSQYSKANINIKNTKSATEDRTFSLDADF